MGPARLNHKRQVNPRHNPKVQINRQNARLSENEQLLPKLSTPQARRADAP